MHQEETWEGPCLSMGLTPHRALTSSPTQTKRESRACPPLHSKTGWPVDSTDHRISGTQCKMKMGCPYSTMIRKPRWWQSIKQGQVLPSSWPCMRASEMPHCWPGSPRSEWKAASVLILSDIFANPAMVDFLLLKTRWFSEISTYLHGSLSLAGPSLSCVGSSSCSQLAFLFSCNTKDRLACG